MNSVLNSQYLFWFLLALPAIAMTMGLIASGDAEPLLHPTGEFAARFMIIAMTISPFRLMFTKNRFWLWIMRRRRYFGVAAFLYALAHTVLYIIDKGSFANVLDEAFLLGIWTGWLAMFIFMDLGGFVHFMPGTVMTIVSGSAILLSIWVWRSSLTAKFQ